MAKLEITRSARGVVDAAELESLEQQVGFELPSDYKTFMMTFGPVGFGDEGVTYDVEWRRVDGKPLSSDEDEDEDEDFEDDFLLLVLSNPEYIRECLSRLWLSGGAKVPRIPDKYFPIAQEAIYPYVVMSLEGDDYGAIYLYYPSDDPWGTGENNYLGYIAKSFTDFIENKIRPYE